MSTNLTMNALILLRVRRELRTDSMIDVYKIAKDLEPLLPDIPVKDIAAAVSAIVVRTRGNAMWSREGSSPRGAKVMLFPERASAVARPATSGIMPQTKPPRAM